MTTSRILVYIAMSLDGFIAGPDDDLSWLTGADPGAPPPPDDGDPPDPGARSYEDFIAGIGALLMGRRTYETVRGFDVPWPYGDLPVLVATTRSLDADPPETVRPVAGTIDELVAEARRVAGEADVYLDGGTLIGQAALAGLIDELTITVAPIAIGAGRPLFAGLTRPCPMDILSHHRFAGGMVQLRARPRR